MPSANVWFRFVVALLATWRVTHLLANEDGPADAIASIRAWLGDRFIGKLMDCFNCLSLWIAAPAALFVSHQPLEWTFTWLALSGGACLLERYQQDPVVIEPVSLIEEGETNHVLRTETLGDAKHCEFFSAEGAHDSNDREYHAVSQDRSSLH